ncbi:uncharacterized protein PAN0_012d4437 [Moesziomyces antarcticus]|uniref:Uncharacterized protein n=1 Tax=Pseudozyma antarctica TaxID=84753 RepID=A0A081CHR9_PSEA2|nr:uncharacterized protein PAN0_012d4437 [Moesziomyces antarcticus]GAK66215.1 hypothetical protein PAN0_012d4437 [Moesziomyces antarcticus]
MKPRPGTKPFAGLRLPGFMPAFGGCSSNEAAAMRSPARPFDRSSVPHHRHSGPPMQATPLIRSPRRARGEQQKQPLVAASKALGASGALGKVHAAKTRFSTSTCLAGPFDHAITRRDIRRPSATPFRPPSARLDLRAPRAWSPPYRHIRLLRIHDCGHFHSIEAFPRPARPLLPTHPGTSHSGKLLNLVLRAPQPERARSD